jgi:hypothetical protein
MGALISHALGLAFLLSLYVLPIDMLTAGLFFIGFALFVNALGVLWKRRHRPSAIVTALIWVVLFPGACLNQVVSWRVASNRVVALGELAQERCRQNGVCPTEEELCGTSGCGTTGTTVRHQLRYARAPDGQRFDVWVRLSIDNQVSAEGGVARSLERVTMTDNVAERTVIEGQ